MFDIQYPSLKIVGEMTRFPVRRIFCVGRNYAAHAKEMGGDARQAPFFFMKPLTALYPGDDNGLYDLPYPQGTTNYHHEVELVVALKSGGTDIKAEHALSHVYGAAVGLDMTRRDLQKASSEKGQPWEFGKTADLSAPVGALHILTENKLDRGAIKLTLNGETKQSGDISDMICGVAELIATLSRFYTLGAGDLIFTGTPEGVGAVEKGDRVEATINNLTPLNIRFV